MDMYAILHTKDSKINFLKGLIRIAKCDSVIDDNEQRFYNQAAYTMGLGQEDVQLLEECRNMEGKIDIFFESSKEKMFFLTQAVQLCWIDGEYTDSEKVEIHCLAEEMGISQSALEAVEDWAYEVWNKKGDELLLLN